MIPRLRWVPLTPYGALELDLHPGELWEALTLEWLGGGIVIVCRPRKR